MTSVAPPPYAARSALSANVCPPLRPLALALHYSVLASALAARATAVAAGAGASSGFAPHHWFGVAALVLVATSWWEQWLAQSRDDFALQEPQLWPDLYSRLTAIALISLGQGDARTHWRRLMPLLIIATLVVATLVVVLGLLSVTPADVLRPPGEWVADVQDAHAICASLLLALLVVDLWALLCRGLQRGRARREA